MSWEMMIEIIMYLARCAGPTVWLTFQVEIWLPVAADGDLP